MEILDPKAAIKKGISDLESGVADESDFDKGEEDEKDLEESDESGKEEDVDF